MNSATRFLLAGAAAIPFLFSGCAMDDNYTPSPDVEKFQNELKNVILEDNLKNSLKVEYVRRWNSENGLVNIAIRARVRSASVYEWVFKAYQYIPIAYRFAWFDEKGTEIPSSDTDTPKWYTLDIQFDEEVGFISVAPNPKSKDFKLFIKLLTKANESTFKAAQPALEKVPAAPVTGKVQDSADQNKKPRVAADVKTEPTTVSGEAAKKEKTAEMKTSSAASVAKDEAAADAAAVRQATPVKPVGTTNKK